MLMNPGVHAFNIIAQELLIAYSKEIKRMRAGLRVIAEGRCREEGYSCRRYAQHLLDNTEGGGPMLHKSTFDYLQPTEHQKDVMFQARLAAKEYATALEQLVPEGPDKTYIMRQLRTLSMWVNVAITRLPDGTPRNYESAAATE